MMLRENIYHADRINEIRKNISDSIINQKSTIDKRKINIMRKIMENC
jgi:hypothetical protein